MRKKILIVINKLLAAVVVMLTATSCKSVKVERVERSEQMMVLYGPQPVEIIEQQEDSVKPLRPEIMLKYGVIPVEYKKIEE